MSNESNEERPGKSTALEVDFREAAFAIPAYERLVLDPEIAHPAARAHELSTTLQLLSNADGFWRGYNYLRASKANLTPIIRQDQFLSFEYNALTTPSSPHPMAPTAANTLLSQMMAVDDARGASQPPRSTEKVRGQVAGLANSLR